MKLFIFPLFFLFLGNIIAQNSDIDIKTTQEVQSKGLGIGLRAGINAIMPYYTNSGAKISPQLFMMNYSLPIELRFSKFWAMQVELGYIENGSTAFVDNVVTDQPFSPDYRVIARDNVELQSINIPTLIKLGTSMNKGKMRMDFLFGPYFDIPLVRRRSGSLTFMYSNEQEDRQSYDIRDTGRNLRKLDMGLEPGISIGLNDSKDARLFFDVRYKFSLMKADNISFQGGPVFSAGILGFMEFANKLK